MIRYLKNQEIDKLEWDTCLKNSHNGLFYASSYYLDTMCDDWHALVDGHYESIFPLPIRQKYGIPYIYAPAFTQQLGLFSPKKPEQQVLQQYLHAIPGKYKVIDLKLNGFNIAPAGVNVKSRHNYLLKLNEDYRIVSEAYHRNHKTNLRKSFTFENRVVKDLEPEEVVKNFILDMPVQTVMGVKQDHFNRLIKVAKVLNKAGEAFTRGITTREGKVISSGLFIKYKKRITFLIGSTSAQGRAEFASWQLFDDVIREFSGNDLILDFEGSDIDGVARFYKGFGAFPEIYHEISIRKFPFNFMDKSW